MSYRPKELIIKQLVLFSVWPGRERGFMVVLSGAVGNSLVLCEGWEEFAIVHNEVIHCCSQMGEEENYLLFSNLHGGRGEILHCSLWELLV